MARASSGAMIVAAIAVFGVAGCEGAGNPFAKKPDAADAASSETSVRLVDRDVEAPKVFQVTDTALWDGRPSLGGVWVASPDAVDPERVILRNPGNGKFVIGALFRRERINPGPALQISSDAAAALGMIAGQPGEINVTALRREEAAPETPDATKPILDANEAVATTALDPVATASGGLDKVSGKASVTKADAAPSMTADAVSVTLPATLPAQAAPVAATKPSSPAGKGALIQIGIFSVEANAKRAADALGKAGVAARVLKDQAQGKDFWRVVAGPAADKSALMAQVKAQGFTDSYFVSR